MKPGGGRQKGASFERWCARELSTHISLDTPIKRNLDQYQTQGQADLELEGVWSIECKRYKPNGAGTWFLNEWWEQCVEAAGNEMIPRLIFKYGRHAVRCVFPIFAINDEWVETEQAYMPVVTGWEDGLMIIGEHLAEV